MLVFDFDGTVYTDSLQSPITHQFDQPIPAKAQLNNFDFNANKEFAFTIVQPITPLAPLLFDLVSERCYEKSDNWQYDFDRYAQFRDVNNFRIPLVCDGYVPLHNFFIRHGCTEEACDTQLSFGGVLNATIDDALGFGVAQHLSTVGVLNTTLDDLQSVVFNATYDINVVRLTLTRTVCTTAETAEPLQKQACSPVQNAAPLFAPEICTTAETASLLQKQACSPVQNADPLFATEICTTAETALLLQKQACSPVQNATPLFATEICTTAETASPLQKQACSPVQNAAPLFATEICTTAEDLTISSGVTSFTIDGLSDNNYTPDKIFTMVKYLTQPSPNFRFIFGGTENVISKQFKSIITSQSCAPSASLDIVISKETCIPAEETEPLPDGRTLIIDPPIIPPIVDPPTTGETFVTPIKDEYLVNNDVTVTLADLTPIGLGNVNLHLDTGLSAWTFSATLIDVSQKTLLKPKEDGTNVMLIITINTYVWHVIIERVVTTRSFNNTTIGLTGRGLTALLSTPYTQPSSISHGLLLTNQQIADQLLPVGWSINWLLPVWNIPANVYSHNSIDTSTALLKLVDDCGGMLVAHRDTQEFTVRKRYPVKPWEFALVNPDVILFDALIFGLTEEPISQYGVNGVLIHGSDVAGQQALVRLTGTAGDRLATTTTNALMVDATAIRSLGERVIASGYPQPKIKSVTTMMDAVTVPLLELGNFMEFNVDSVTDRGIVSSIDVAVGLENGAVTVEQTVSVGESTNNVFELLQDLLPKKVLQLATLNSTDGVTSLMQLVDGAVVRVRGTGTVNNKYYILDGALETEAPSVTIIADVVV